MPYDSKGLEGLTPQEKALSLHIRGEICASPANVTGGDVYDFKAYDRNIQMQHEWAANASAEREALFARQSEEFHRLFGVADDAPFAPKQN